MTPSPTLTHLSAATAACMRYARQLGLSDREIVEGVLDGTLLAMIRAVQPELEGQRQLVLVAVVGPAFATGSSCRSSPEKRP